MSHFGFLLSLLLLVGCASTDSELNPNVHFAAYAAEGFNFYKAPPEHPEWEPQDFYFKDCQLLGRGNHISKVEYSCFYP